MRRETALGKKLHVDDIDLPWTYARTDDSGAIFGLEQDCLATVFNNDLTSVAYAPNNYRVMHKGGLVTKPTPVEYVTSHGDGSSHGATWGHFADLLRSLGPAYFPKLDDRSIELHLDGLQNMALEGTNYFGGGWEVIHQGLSEARRDLLEGKGYLQGPFYQGLGWLATNFAEREEAAVDKLISTTF